MTTQGPQIGLGPVHYQINKIAKCDEKLIDSCDTDHRCCAVVACDYCLEWEEYGEAILYGFAGTNGQGDLSGDVAGMAFLATIRRDSYEDKCELWVYLDETVVAVIPLCEELISCRDVSWETSVTLAAESYGADDITGILRWIKLEKRPLPLTNRVGECVSKFCGNCNCTCRELCVKLTGPDGDILCSTVLGEAPYVTDCDGPLWEGLLTCGYVDRDLSFTIRRDEYSGGCVFVASVDGETFEFELIQCDAIDFEFQLADGSFVSVACKECDCTEEVIVYPCECGSLDPNGYGAWGTIEESVSVCDIPIISGTSASLPVSNIAWIPGEDTCVLPVALGHLIIAFPPNCTESDPDAASKRVVFVKKGGTSETPNIDNDLVQQNDWYAVVYDLSDDVILGVFYEYDICCYNETPENPASSHFIWLKVFGVVLGSAVYTVGLYGQANADEYGNCGFVRPTPPL